jgi:hypothetical protein
MVSDDFPIPLHTPVHLLDVAEREWPGMKHTPQYHNVKRLDR